MSAAPIDRTAWRWHFAPDDVTDYDEAARYVGRATSDGELPRSSPSRSAKRFTDRRARVNALRHRSGVPPRRPGGARRPIAGCAIGRPIPTPDDLYGHSRMMPRSGCWMVAVRFDIRLHRG